MAAPDSDPSLSTKRLAGKVAIITGGASGIGATSARLFVSHGALVAIADVQDSLGQSLAASLSPHAKFFRCDVTQEPDVANLVTLHHPPLRPPRYHVYQRRHLWPYRSARRPRHRRLRPRVRRQPPRRPALHETCRQSHDPQKKGVILATASVAAVLGGEAPLAYSISKTGLVGMLKSASFELGKYGIRVNSVSPAGVPTPMTRIYLGDGGGGSDPRPDEELAVALSAAADLKGAVLMADDVARAALFLVSEEAQFVSGHNLVVDGGFSVTKGRVPTGSQQ